MINFSRRLATILILAPFFVSFGVIAETITVGGVGSLSPLLKYLAKDYAKKQPGVEIVVVHPPLGTSGGMRALAAGKVDITLAGRELNAKEKGVAKVWVQTPLVLATFGGKSAGLSSAQVADIYAGRKSVWDDGKPIRLVLRGAHESETQSLRTMAPEIDAAVGEALKRPELPVAENDIEAIEFIGKIPGSLGTTTLGLIRSEGVRVEPLTINGQIPGIKALEEGRYSWRRVYYLVTRDNPTPATAAFLAYLNSPAVRPIIRNLDFLPIP